MNWWRSLFFVHESRFICLFSLLRSALRPTIRFYKLTFFGFDCGFTSSSREIWLLLTQAEVLRVGGKSTPPPLYSAQVVQILQLNSEFWKHFFCSVSNYKLFIDWNCADRTTFTFLKSSDRSILNMQRFAKSYQTWFAIKNKL